MMILPKRSVYSPVSEMQEKGITEFNRRKMNLRSKQSKSTHGEREHSKTVTKDNNNSRCKQTQKANLAMLESGN